MKEIPLELTMVDVALLVALAAVSVVKDSDALEVDSKIKALAIKCAAYSTVDFGDTGRYRVVTPTIEVIF